MGVNNLVKSYFWYLSLIRVLYLFIPPQFSCHFTRFLSLSLLHSLHPAPPDFIQQKDQKWHYIVYFFSLPISSFSFFSLPLSLSLLQNEENGWQPHIRAKRPKMAANLDQILSTEESKECLGYSFNGQILERTQDSIFFLYMSPLNPPPPPPPLMYRG